MKMSTTSDSKPDNYQVNAKICRLVERYPCMYDRSHPYYLKKDVVDKAWVKIAREMDDSISSCKERWRNIRTSFARSINVNKVPSSANRTKPYYLHEELQFLARHITPGIPVIRRSNYCSASEESEVIEVSVGEESFDGFAAMVHQAEEDSQECHQSSIDEGNETMKMEQSQTELPSQPTAATMPAPSREEEPDVPTTPLYPFKKRLRTSEPLTSDTEQEREVKPQPSELAQDGDFDVTFLQGLLPEMKAMNFRQKIVFKKRIYEVIAEIFENTAHMHASNGVASRASPPATASSTTNSNSSSTSTTPTMTLVNAADLAMIRRLNTLLQNPAIASSTPPMTTLPKNVASISSTVRSSTPTTTTVAMHRGALTRSSANLMRVTMLNPLMPTSSTTANGQTTQTVKQEMEDD